MGVGTLSRGGVRHQRRPAGNDGSRHGPLTRAESGCRRARPVGMHGAYPSPATSSTISNTRAAGVRRSLARRVLCHSDPAVASRRIAPRSARSPARRRATRIRPVPAAACHSDPPRPRPPPATLSGLRKRASSIGAGGAPIGPIAAIRSLRGVWVARSKRYVSLRARGWRDAPRREARRGGAAGAGPRAGRARRAEDGWGVGCVERQALTAIEARADSQSCLNLTMPCRSAGGGPSAGGP